MSEHDRNLLDQIAIEAMKIFLNESRVKHPKNIANDSYKIAQAMMEERERQ